MPAGSGGYGTKEVGGSVASTLKRQAAKRVSYDNTKLRPRSAGGNGKFGGLPGGPSGGSMGSRGKR